MPILRQSMKGHPAWCELDHFAVAAVAPGEVVWWRPVHRANKLVVAGGRCRVRSQRLEHVLDEADVLDLEPAEHILTADDAALVVELEGHWGLDCGGAGVFRVENSRSATDVDGLAYPKQTDFDRHYHDCDEYWIIVSGRGTVVTEDTIYQVGPGDCVATRMGHHHDFPSVAEPVLAVYFETTLRGQGRRGHLWEDVHGPAQSP